MEQHAEVLRGGFWHKRAPNWGDLIALGLVLATIVLIGSGARQMVAPFVATQQPEISLSPKVLPAYALRTTMRMLAALVASLIFTFSYATLAAKSRRAEMVLIPVLDVPQSVPVLGYLSFSVVFFAAITASGGAWNASIISEAVNWGSTKIDGSGLGAYIAQMTEAGDYPRIALGIAVMSVLVVTINRLLWRPLYAFAERRTRLD